MEISSAVRSISGSPMNAAPGRRLDAVMRGHIACIQYASAQCGDNLASGTRRGFGEKRFSLGPSRPMMAEIDRDHVPGGSDTDCPGMSAWKKPSRIAWRRNERMT